MRHLFLITTKGFGYRQKKLAVIVTYSREAYDQQVTFFIMDQTDICRDCYARFKDEETLSAPKIFLKEEFYRTFLMIAGKLPVWTVLPVSGRAGNLTEILALNDDLIDLGQIAGVPMADVLKGLLWHICKSGEDPVKAVIKATMIYSYGFTPGQDSSENSTPKKPYLDKL